MANNKVAIIFYIVFPFTVTILSCLSKVRTDDFYCDSKADIDVWRIPVVRPIELISADFKSNTWNLATYPHVNMSHVFHSADSINYNNGKILLFSSYERFVIIDLALESDTAFFSRTEFEKYTGVNRLSNKLFNVRELYESWVDTKSLPWDNQLGFKVECDSK